MRHFSIVVLLGLSLFLGSCATQPPANTDSMADASSESSVANLVFGLEEVQSEGWSTYTSEKLGVSFKYPVTFVVAENAGEIVIQRDVETSSDKVTMKKVKSTLAKEIEKHLYRAVRIEKTFGSPGRPIETAIAHYQSGDANSWFMTYFITRSSDTPSFPDYVEKSPTYDVIVADVEAFPPEADTNAAMQMNRVQDLLSEPQQILSTVRFAK